MHENMKLKQEAAAAFLDLGCFFQKISLISCGNMMENHHHHHHYRLQQQQQQVLHVDRITM